MSKGTAPEALAGHADRKRYYVILCAAVLIGWFGVNAGILALGRTPMWRDDALPLYVNFMAWEGQALRDAFTSLFAGNGFAFPMFTYSLGYGADTIVTMMGSLSDPFNLISVFFPPELAEVPYVITIPVRLAFAAAVFSWYCFERGHGNGETLVASLCYTFSGYTVFWGILRHASFINLSITLPLVLLGADRIFSGKKPTTFIWGIAIQFLISVYFTYMLCISLLLYCLVKYFFAPRVRSAADFVKLVGKFVGYLLIGFCIGAVFALPSVIALLSQGRATGGAEIPLLFSLRYYAAIGVQTVGGLVVTRGLYLGAVTIVLGMVFVFCRRRFDAAIRRPWLIALALCAVGVLVPYVGHVFNGFGYESDRWMVLYNFVCSYVVCLTIPAIANLERAERKRLLFGIGLISCWALAYAVYEALFDSGPLSAIWPLFMIALLFVVYKLTTWNGRRYCALLACVVLIGVSGNAVFDCSPLGNSYVKYFPAFGAAGHDLTDASPAAVIDKLDDDSLFRQTYGRLYGGRKNAALNHGTMGVDFYSSYYNQFVDDYRQELGICDHYRNFSFIGNDSRLPLETLAGVKYFISNDGDVWRAPYGFAEIASMKAGSTNYHVFESDGSLPIGFVTDCVVPRSSYDKLTMVAKQSALLDGAVVEPRDLTGEYTIVQPVQTAVPVEYTIEKTDGLDIDGGVVVTTKNNASMTLSFNGLTDAETYVVFDDLHFSQHSPVQLAEINNQEVTPMVQLRELVWGESTLYEVDCAIGDNHKSFTAATPKASGYGGKHNWVVNMGYSKDSCTTITIKFDKAGTYTFADLGIYCEAVEPIVEKAGKLGANALDDLHLDVNQMKATADLGTSQSGLAFFSVAYTRGWSATVDGAEAPVLRADTAFMAVELEGEGEHEIVLTYATPGLKEGALISVLGLVAFVAVTMVRRRKPRESE